MKFAYCRVYFFLSKNISLSESNLLFFYTCNVYRKKERVERKIELFTIQHTIYIYIIEDIFITEKVRGEEKLYYFHSLSLFK